MARIYLVRNGRTEEGAGFEVNPGLDEVGVEQANAVAELLGSLAAMTILTSPQRRARETAKPLALKWHATPMVDETISLMPMPEAGTSDRKAWLLAFMKGAWRDAPEAQQHWREACLARLGVLRHDTVIFSHFVVINMIVGAALEDDRVTVFQPDNGSITIMEIADGRLTLLERGRQAATRLL